MNLVYKHEKPLLLVTAVLAVAIWLALILGGTLGIVLLYLLVGGYVFFLFAHSAFISHLKGGLGGCESVASNIRISMTGLFVVAKRLGG